MAAAIDTLRRPVLEERQHGPDPWPGRDAHGPTFDRVEERRALPRVGQEVEIPGEEWAREPGIDGRPTHRPAEPVCAGREVPDQLPGVPVAPEHQDPGDPSRERRVIEDQGGGTEPHADRDHR